MTSLQLYPGCRLPMPRDTIQDRHRSNVVIAAVAAAVAAYRNLYMGSTLVKQQYMTTSEQKLLKNIFETKIVMTKSFF